MRGTQREEGKSCFKCYLKSCAFLFLFFWKILFFHYQSFSNENEAIFFFFGKNDWPYVRLTLDIHTLGSRDKCYSERRALNVRLTFVYPHLINDYMRDHAVAQKAGRYILYELLI